jgi:alpha-beta hydrolase superfamily lysophospholipase
MICYGGSSGTVASVEVDVLGASDGRRTIDLGADDEGPGSAVLVSRRADRPTSAAVLYVYGFVDYFFQTHLADFHVAQGFDSYPLDLRKHGRSRQPHRTPNYCTSVAEYYAELDEPARIIREKDDHDRLLVNGHSTGGMITSLWAHDRRDAAVVDAMFINDPFLDIDAPWLLRDVATPIAVPIGPVRPKTDVGTGLNDVCPRRIHADYGGEWDDDPRWTPAL